MRKFLAVAALGAALALNAPAQALEDTTVEQDVSCLIASLVLIQSGEPEAQENGLKSFMYWLGRLDGAEPELDLEVRVADVAPRMTNEILAAEFIRCGGLLVVRGREVEAIGARLTDRGL